MSDKKISACTELTTPAGADVFPIIDSSEAADANKNKKITITTLFNKLHDGAVGSPTVGWNSDAGTTGIYRSAEDEVGFSCNSAFKGAFNSNGLKLGTGTAAAQLHLFSSDTTDQVIIENTDTGADTAPDLVLFRNSASPAADDNLGNIEFRGEDSNSNTQAYAQITSVIADTTDGSEDGILDLMTASAGTVASRLRIQSQFVGIGEATSPAFTCHIQTSITGTALRTECTANDAASGGDITLYHRRGASGVGQDNDILGTVWYRGRNDASSGAQEIDFGCIEGSILDASDTTEDGRLRFKVESAGTLETQLTIEPTVSTFAQNVIFSEGITVADNKNIVLNTTNGTKIGTHVGQKLGLWNVTPVVQPSAIANITTTASSGTLPTANGSITIANAATPTVVELLEYCTEIEAKLESVLATLRTVGIIAA